MKEKGIKLYKDGAQVATSIRIMRVKGQLQKDGKPIYLDDFPGLLSQDADPTAIIASYTDGNDDEGSLRIWKHVEGDLLEWRLCSQCQRHYLAEAGKKISTCGASCRQGLMRLLRQKRRAKDVASAEEEATKSLRVFVCSICQHQCGNRPALDTHMRLQHPI